MKTSLYNIEVEKTEEGKKLYYNSYTGAFVELEEEYENILKTLKSENSEDFDQEKLNELNSVGFVIDDRLDERLVMKYNRNLTKYESDTVMLTVAPTLSCNMNCAYCYENKSAKHMSDEVKENLKKFIERKIENGAKSVSICWYGGEPTLQYDTIVELSRDIITLCEEKKVNYGASMISNGVLLTEEKAKVFAEECRVGNVQITLDGYEDTHNNSRTMVNGQKSFRTIVNNIKDIRKYMFVSIRVNVSEKNRGDIDRLFTHLNDEEKIFEDSKVSMYLAPVTNCQEACKIENNTLINHDNFGDIHQEYLKMIYKKNGTKTSRLYNYPQPTTASCSAEMRNGYVVGPEGELYKCYQEIGLEEKIVGYLTGESANESVYLKYMETDIPEECEKCEYLPLCQGGCLSERFKNGNQPYCYTRKSTIKKDLSMFYKLWKKDNGIFDNFKR